MRARNMIRWTVLGAAVATVGCATTKPSKELVDARQAYAQAERGPAAKYEPDHLQAAKQSLKNAEQRNDDDPEALSTRSSAYVASRLALRAHAGGEASQARADAASMEEYYVKLLEHDRKQTQAQLERTQDQANDLNNKLSSTRNELAQIADKMQEQGADLDSLRKRKAVLESREANLEEQLQSEKQARIEAEEKAAAAMASLERIAAIKEEQRGWVITLSGQVLFETGKHALLPIAKQKLAKVAEALKAQDEDKVIVVEGHTDSRGSDSMNQKLSQNRAQSVVDYLISQGVDSSRLKAVGKGEEQPVADNNSPEGRANNRRVEIIVKDK